MLRGGCPRGKLYATNWLDGISDSSDCDVVEVSFKNTRVGFYSNPSAIPLGIGDIVAVEGNPGHDIGRVSMVGRLVRLQMRKNGVKPDSELKRVFRIATQTDLEKFEEARSREHSTMIRTRKIAEELQLNMKIGDVEYQGDGGIGPCGRPLCCASWMTHFVSVGTGAARVQDLSMNPQKLAGQCAKLKCCLNFETDVYSEAQKKMPPKDAVLETKDSLYYFFKPDILAGTVTYSTDKRIPANLVTIEARRAFEIIALNKKGVKVDSLLSESKAAEAARPTYVDLVEQESLTRFDKSKKKKKKKNNQNKNTDKTVKGGEKAANAGAAPKQEKADKKSEDTRRNDRRRDQRQKRKPNMPKKTEE